VDIYLWPGKSSYEIRELGGRLEYRRLEGPQENRMRLGSQ
jgi:hypothetical protein